jgi:transcriptional regulator with XRE-family HTH domain
MRQRDLADKVGVSVPTIQRLEQDDARVQVETLAAAAKVLGLSFDWRTRRVLAPADIPADAIINAADPILVPPIPTWPIDLVAGPWSHLPALCQLDYDDPEQRAIINYGRFRLRILGNSMAPDYPDHVTIEFEILRADSPPVLYADYAVCRSDDTATFKRLIKQTEDSLVLAALNQRDYPGTIEVFRQDVVRLARAVAIIGPVPLPSPIEIPRAPKLPKIRRG